MPTKKEILRQRRHIKIRQKVRGTTKRPRLLVVRSLLYNYAKLIDDSNGKVLTSVNDKKEKKGTKVEKAKKVGEELAAKAKELKISEVVFDRNGYKYHGRVKAIADGAREGGLKF